MTVNDLHKAVIVKAIQHFDANTNESVAAWHTWWERHRSCKVCGQHVGEQPVIGPLYGEDSYHARCLIDLIKSPARPQITN